MTAKEKREKILIIGTGGVGMIAALCLELNNNCDITCVVRSDYTKATKEGYKIESANYGVFENWKPTNIVKSVEDAVQFGPFEFIVVCTKNIPDGPTPVNTFLEPVVTPIISTIVLVQNGIDIEKECIASFPQNIFLSGVTLIGSTNMNCHVVQSGFDNLSVGCFYNNSNFTTEEHDAEAKKFISLYSNEKNNVSYDANVRLTRWKKLVYNSSINTCTAIVGLDFTRASMANAKESIMRPAIKEIYKVAKSDGYEIPPEIEDVMLNISDGLFYSPSMLVDVKKNRLMELETILGNPIRIAKKNNVDVPILNTLYNLLYMIQFKLKEHNGLIKVDEIIDSSRKKEQYGNGF
ncbi:hypothetical protein PACTADRAFT_2046 [Pachysolen tannophilus NRRL Y-2460]|uniref:2-dehydropantoate 2-reductase n=1 Tax=Pachysolen tannophilus NRRL Y-2460 TaxID=669874 RepID=A0A1E4TVE0_PACTA|nr:hypothetical protein PACTADRAFT_2046 [Pachysolen tannophilus NRRL Y-2460]